MAPEKRSYRRWARLRVPAGGHLRKLQRVAGGGNSSPDGGDIPLGHGGLGIRAEHSAVKAQHCPWENEDFKITIFMAW